MHNFNALRTFVARIGRTINEAGASLVEYTLLVALIAAVAIGAVGFLGDSASTELCGAGAKIAAHDSAAVPAAGDCA